MNELRIEESKSGFWVKSDDVVIGPFKTFEVAKSWVDAQNNSKTDWKHTNNLPCECKCGCK